MRRAVYLASVVAAALGMFLPILYGNVRFLRSVMEDPLPVSVAVMVAAWLFAYLLYTEDEPTAS
ncbi:hypothetical protein [Thermococcus sp.]|uniref:hypothetical protein n=1 Tax=Thermococcus sp. TaxID=35749 RepID=UPI0026222F9B|nr:hypothetical protein [Thermococcus sp.]